MMETLRKFLKVNKLLSTPSKLLKIFISLIKQVPK